MKTTSQFTAISYKLSAIHLKFISYLLLLTSCLLPIGSAFGQDLYSSAQFDKKYDIVMANPGVQIEATEAINKLYNYQFAEAEAEFRWLQHRYPWHPMPYFLMGLAEWWKMVPNIENTQFDARCIAYMDTCILLSERLYDARENKVEAAFFLAASNAFKARIHSERKHWTRATFTTKATLKYLNICKQYGDLNPELLFGDGLYNYFAEWIPKEYPLLKPIIWMFPRGGKKKGIEQLEKTSYNAFYTRTEARYFLLQIYGYENDYAKAYDLAKYQSKTYPQNPYFERMYCRSAFVKGHSDEATASAKSILDKIAKGQFGYEGVSGRNAAYVLAHYNHLYYRDFAKAKQYYNQSIAFAKQTKSTTSGYYNASLMGLGRIAEAEKQYDVALNYYKTVVDDAERKSTQFKEAKAAIDGLKKIRRDERRRRRD